MLAVNFHHKDRHKIYIMCMHREVPYGAKFRWGKILMNGHMEKFDEKNFDEFHKINAHIY